MEESTTTPRASRAMLYTVIAAVGGIALGLAIGLLAGGTEATPADPAAIVVETGGEESVITPEAAEAAGYIPAPSYRVIAKEEADKLEKGMTLEEVQALFPDVSLVSTTVSVQPLPHSEGNSWVSEAVSIGLSPDGQIQATFSNGELAFWGWEQSASSAAFGQYAPNRLILAVQQGGDAEGPAF